MSFPPFSGPLFSRVDLHAAGADAPDAGGTISESGISSPKFLSRTVKYLDV